MTLKELERTLRRLFEQKLGLKPHGPLHPLEVARQLADALVPGSQPGLVGQTAPNTFVVHLHPGDEIPLTALGDSLYQELFRYLAAEAHHRDLRWIGPVTIVFTPDAAIPSGSVQVHASISPAQAPRQTWRDFTLQAPVLYGISGFAAGQTFALRLPHSTIGRDKACDVRIGDPKVSHRHARIVWAADAFSLEDLGSKAGTWHNDARIVSPTPLQSGDRLTLGHSTLRFDMPSRPKSPPHA